MKKLFYIFIVAGFCLAAPAVAGAATLVSGDLTADTTWTTDGSPYIVQSIFDIPRGVTLTINPGVVVKSAGNLFFTVDGHLVANGTPDNKIYFTTTNDDSVGGVTSDSEDFCPVGDWGIVGDVASNISISNAELRNLMYGVTLNGQGMYMFASFDNVSFSGDDPTIYAGYAILSLSHIDLNQGYNSWAMMIGRGGTTMDDVSIHNGNNGIYAQNVAITATNLHISNMLGPGIFMDAGQLFLSDSSITNVSPGTGGAALELDNDGPSQIASTTISNVDGAAIQVLYGGGLSFSNLSISSSTEGFEINNLSNSSETISSSTISNIDDSAISVTDGALTITGTMIQNAAYGLESFGNSVVNMTQSVLETVDQYAAAALGNNIVSAEDNFWGDPSGPYNADSNPSGLGSAVTDNVDFSNWLSPLVPTSTPPEADYNINNT